MTCSVHALLELTAQVDDLMQVLELPLDLKDSLRGAQGVGNSAAPGDGRAGQAGRDAVQ